jgi:hypothetical protein
MSTDMNTGEQYAFRQSQIKKTGLAVRDMTLIRFIYVWQSSRGKISIPVFTIRNAAVSGLLLSSLLLGARRAMLAPWKFFFC